MDVVEERVDAVEVVNAFEIVGVGWWVLESAPIVVLLGWVEG